MVEWANIASITWGETYKAAQPQSPAETKATPIELPAKLYSMLGTITAIGVFVVALLFFRH